MPTPINDFKAFGVGPGDDATSQTEYVAATWRVQGWRSGILPHQQINKVLRQTSSVAAAVAQTVADLTQADVIDDGNVTALTNQVKLAFSAYLPYNSGTTYPPGSIGYAIQNFTGGGSMTGEAIRAALTGSLTTAEFAATVNNRLDLIDAPVTGLVTQVSSLTTAVGSTASAASSASAAAASAADALARANAAAVSAGAALTSETNANTSRVSAATSASNASTSASNAATSASSAAGSASSASTSAGAAATSATAAGNSAAAAATSATSASTSATNAGTSAAAADSSKVIAQTKAAEASVSATNAATSASTAAGSASTATTKADLAAASESAAAASAGAASVSQSAAATSASNASTSASNASTSAGVASSAASAAAGHASAASTSAVSASTSAGDAAGSAAAAASWYTSTVAATGSLTASVSTLQSAVSGVNGLQAQYAMKVVATRPDGKKVFGYMGLQATAPNDNTVGQSEILMAADRLVFVPLSDPNAAPVQPFIVGLVDGVTTLIVGQAVIGDNTILPRSINTPSLSALSALLGNVRIDAAGQLIMGMSAYGVGSGICIGYDAGEYSLIIGDKTAAYLEYKPSTGLRQYNVQSINQGGIQPIGNYRQIGLRVLPTGSGTATAKVEFRADGSIWGVRTQSNGVNAVAALGSWFTPATSGVGSGYEILLEVLSNDGGTLTNDATNWISLGATRGLQLTFTSTGFFAYTLTGRYTIRLAGGQQVASGAINLDISREP